MRAFALLAGVSCLAACSGSPDAGVDEGGGGQGEKEDKVSDLVPYRGGRVLHEPVEVHIYWGAYWERGQGAEERALLDRFAEVVGDSGWYAVVGEYRDRVAAPGPSRAGDPLVVSDSEPGDVVSDKRIRASLQAWLNDGRVTWNPEAVYFVFTPPGTVQSTQWGKSCDKICAYHYHFAGTIAGADARVLYAGIPYGDCPEGCGSPLRAHTPELDQMTVELGHELTEAVTDPTIEAWTEPHGEGEVADRCEDGHFMVATMDGSRFALQELWSNAAGRCVRGL